MADKEIRKPSGKKVPVKKKTVTQREKYVKELKSMLKDIPEEGLLFMIKQASVLIHNKKVEELNRGGETVKKVSKSPSKTAGKGKVQSGNVTIEKGTFGKSFIMVLPGARKTFDSGEIAALLKLVSGSKSSSEGAVRIYSWLERNRGDVLVDAGIKNKGAEVLTGMVKCLKKTFPVKK